MQQLGCESHSVTCVSCYVHVYGNKVIIIIGVNRPAIVREIPHFDLFPAFLPERLAFLALFRNYKNR